MRAPPLARMAAVAAPRPDAEPVTTAHKPSFDIRISSYCLFANPLLTAIYHIVQAKPCKSAKLRCAELVPAGGHPASCHFRRAPCCDRRLSWRWLFLIMRCKKRPHPMLGPDGAGAMCQ